MDENWEELLSFGLSMTSIVFNMIIIFNLVEKNTTYNQIMSSVIKLECLFLYSQAFTLCISKSDQTDSFSLFNYLIRGMSYLL